MTTEMIHPVVQTIELDCAPFTPRPDELLPGVLEGTGLPVRERVSAVFGCWTFDYSDIPAEEWMKVRPTLEARIKALYHAGAIRYGSW